MARKPYTGGPLNKVNSKCGISAPNKSVSVSGLIKAHNPKSAEELERLIALHSKEICKCGIVSKGTIEDFGRNLYNAQKEYLGEYKYSVEECIQWEYDLFILQMLKGKTMEDNCLSELKKMLGSQYNINLTSYYVDETLRVDLEVTKNNNIIAGIQVKPSSFNQIRESIRIFNMEANKKYSKPVLYVYYEYDSEQFLNLNKVVTEIQKL